MDAGAKNQQGRKQIADNFQARSTALKSTPLYGRGLARRLKSHPKILTVILLKRKNTSGRRVVKLVTKVNVG